MERTGASQEQVEAWLARRFPDPRPFGEREWAASRSTRRRQWLVLVVFVAVVVAVGYLVFAVGDSADPARTTPAERYAWVAVLAWVLEVAGLVAPIVALVLLLRLSARDQRSFVLRAVKALDPAQRRELADEIRGRRPVVPGDESVLVGIASSRAALSTAFAWLGVTSAVNAVRPWLDSTAGPLHLTIRTGTTALGLLALVVGIVRGRRARAFLRRVGPATTGAPAPTP